MSTTDFTKITDTKYCGRCKTYRRLDLFKGFKDPSVRYSHCQLCERKRRLYYKDQGLYRRSQRKHAARLRSQHQKLICDYLKDHPCVDCGLTNLLVLEFDHLSNKKESIAEMKGRRTSFALLQEIEKCEVRCANCHRVKTESQQPGYKTDFQIRYRGNGLIPDVVNGNTLVYAHLLRHTCTDCGEDNPVMLDFDHLKDKTRNVSKMKGLKDLEKIRAEIAKCEVVCANCHRIRSETRNPGYRWTEVQGQSLSEA